MKIRLSQICMLSLVLLGCGQALQRGMLGTTYISTSRPAISITAPNMPMILAGSGTANMLWTEMIGGLPIDMWLAVYGNGADGPVAVAAQAQLPQGWIWDSDMVKPFSVDQANEVLGGTDYQACTFIVKAENDPFGALLTGERPWLVRSFQSLHNFKQDKIILQYREPLPEGVVSLAALPLGQDRLLADFARRARSAFLIGSVPAEKFKVQRGYAADIWWRYMDQRFLGTASRQDLYQRD